MNLVFSITAYPPSTGGAQSHAHKLAQHLCVNHQLKVLTLWDQNRTDWLAGTTFGMPNDPSDYVIDDIPVHKLGLSTAEKTKTLPWVISYLPFQKVAIKEIARVYQNQISLLLSEANLIHNFRIGREPFSYAGYEISKKQGIPFVLTPFHHPRWNSWFHRYYLALYQKADAVIALTQSEKNTLASLGVEPQRIFVTGHGPVISPVKPNHSFRQSYQIGENPMILFLGQKYPYKGVDALIEAAPIVWSKYPTAYFVFIGPRTKYSQSLFTKNADSRIIEIGIVDPEEKSNALDACDLLCVPSSQESFGGVYTEAWMFKKPVIGCDIPAVAEVIDNNKNGYTVSQEADKIAEKIIALLSKPTVANDMGEAGYEKVMAQYSWDQITAKTEEAYHFAQQNLCGIHA